MADLIVEEITIDVPQSDIVREIRLSTPPFTFKGKFPDVPFAPGVDYAALTVGDDKPLFVVRPLGVRGAISENNLKYDQELLDEIRDQVITRKPAARQGHVSEESSNYEFPPDVGLWVGAIQVGDTLFGKSYIYPDTRFHQMVVKRKAAGSTLSNSIWGKGHFETNNDGTQRLRGLALESIDFAPAERAALDALGSDFDITSEMSEKVIEMTDTHDDKAQDLALIRDELAKRIKETAPHALHELMTKEQRQHCAEMHLREMDANSVYEMLPQTHRSAIHECYVKEFEPKMPAAELGQLTDLKTSVAEMQRTIAEYRQREFDTALDNAAFSRFSTWNISREEDRQAVASAKENFKMFIVAQMATMTGGQKLENISEATETAWPKYEPQAALLKTAISGGSVITSLEGTVSEQRSRNYGYDPKTGQYDPEYAARMRAYVAPK